MKIIPIIRQFFHLRHAYADIQTMKEKVSILEKEIKTFRNNDTKNTKELIGRMLSNANKGKKIKSLHEVEFSVFSQWGDDGIIQYLVDTLNIENKTFVEFGVENYIESNTRFLLINNNWSGLVIDGSAENVEYIKKDDVSWLYDLHAMEAFITKENINLLLSNLPFGQKIGILSIDIDGNDYWIWKEISVVDPDIVIVEYNSILGCKRPLTLPYSSDYVRKRKYPDMNYYGTSLMSICDLAQTKGYTFVGCNSNGNNAYFVRNSLASALPKVTIEEGYVEAKFREVWDDEKKPLFGVHKFNSLKGYKYFDTRLNTEITL